MLSDLAEYSIMLNGEKAVTHTSSHYATSEGKFEKVTLPPINGYFRLTENTLNLFNFHSLALISATPSLTSSSLAAELPLNSPRLASSEMHAPSIPEAANRLITISSSPVFTGEHAEEDASGKKRRQRLGPSCDHCRSRKVKCNADVVLLSRYFVASELDLEFKDELVLTGEQKSQLCSGAEVRTANNSVLVVSNNKLIKFLPCSSCCTKSLNCCFSKGFTKEDVIHNKKRETWTSVAGDKKYNVNKVTKKAMSPKPCTLQLTGSSVKASLGVSTPDTSFLSDSAYSPGAAGSTRKSSCNACRKRKIKCVLSSHSAKCMGCIKKDCLCSFEL
ncbi:hypothetical protein PUMCH_003115 [Australozyma saopauloensis]|uniref:Zn(2)-C6 fungal-type domain-containing protein n=1 Tax=Australozyma saopauloensis TaxID=291208 RepID=A0AAX4HDK0_9ASCO|nr:hypothetical protein PUMCH_003115 [[Candida] saopauloensis]